MRFTIIGSLEIGIQRTILKWKCITVVFEQFGVCMNCVCDDTFSYINKEVMPQLKTLDAHTGVS